MSGLVLRRLTSGALLLLLVATSLLRDRCPMDPRACGARVAAASPCHGGPSGGWRARTPPCCHAAPKSEAPATLDPAAVVLASPEAAATVASPTFTGRRPVASSRAALHGHGPPVLVLRI